MRMLRSFSPNGARSRTRVTQGQPEHFAAALEAAILAAAQHAPAGLGAQAQKQQQAQALQAWRAQLARLPHMPPPPKLLPGTAVEDGGLLEGMNDDDE